MEVNSVQNRAGDFAPIVEEDGLTAGAEAFRVAQVPAGAGVHGSDEHEFGGKLERILGASNGDGTVLERLTEIFQDSLGKFTKFIQKKHASVS